MSEDSSEKDDDHATHLKEGIAPITIEEEMRSSYLDYAMSVIVARAIPDARDGLKPVHRRILYSMHENGYTHGKPYRKSARVVGDVIGKYHPHGDQAVYDSLVRMAQDFSMRLPLVDGQGNFGSIDGDPPAAMRYTEVRMESVTETLVSDLDKDTVDFQPNYDSSEHEPVVMPSRLPNLLINGSNGIAVGMATNIPPHNPGEMVDACLALLDDPSLSDEALLEIVPGPDFPTGADIVGRSGARSALLTGRGSVIMRAKTVIEETDKGRSVIVVTEIPYQVNKAAMIEKIAVLVREKRIEGITDLRDESDREGMRIVMTLKRDADPAVVLNQLYRHSQLQSSFGVNMLALNNGRPEMLTLRRFIDIFLDFREYVVARRAKYLLRKARTRAHVLVGLACAVANIDDVIRLIRQTSDPASARAALLERLWPAGDLGPLIALVADPRSRVSSEGTLRLTEDQARAILDLRLHRLTALGRSEIDEEAQKLAQNIRDLLDLLSSREKIQAVVREELQDIRDNFSSPRRTHFIEGEGDVDDEDLITREDMVITVTHGGYVKRTPLTDYRTQRRGGKGRSGMNTKEEDFVNTFFVASTHAPVLFFTSKGQVYKLKVWKLPLGGPHARGKAFINLLPLSQGERVTTVMPLPEDEESWKNLDIMFATHSGRVRRNRLSDFTNVHRGGKIAMKPEEGDGIVDVSLCTEDDDIHLTTTKGRAIRFSVKDVRVFVGRTSSGIRGIKLAEGDEVISMEVLRHVDVTPEETKAYLRHAAAMRRAIGEAGEDETSLSEEAGLDPVLSPERLAELGALEQVILSLTDTGFGKRSLSYEYRCMNRGGQGVTAHDLGRTGGRLAASFRVEESDEIMLVTDGGQLIRCPISGVRVAARNTKGVRIIRLKEGEKVMSVDRIIDTSHSETESDPDASTEDV